MQAFRGTLARLDRTLSAPAVIRALDRRDSLTANLATMTAQFTTTGARLDTVLMRVQTGKGTIGKFATDTALYADHAGGSRSR